MMNHQINRGTCLWVALSCASAVQAPVGVVYAVLAWSADARHWHYIQPERSFIPLGFGSQRRLISKKSTCCVHTQYFFRFWLISMDSVREGAKQIASSSHG